VLVLWANLHGSVVLGAFLTALYGTVLLIGDRHANALKGTALLALAPFAVLCSPYGLSLVGYYRHLLINPPFGRLVSEWTAPTPSRRSGPWGGGAASSPASSAWLCS
jgi:hypothetical protein